MDRHDEERALRALIDGAGDERAATVVVERVVPRLTSFLRARYPALSPDDAHDVARDALLVALERRARPEPRLLDERARGVGLRRRRPGDRPDVGDRVGRPRRGAARKGLTCYARRYIVVRRKM